MTPPRCPAYPKLTKYKKIDPGAYALAPEPPKQLGAKDQYGDYPTAIRTTRTLIQQYNSLVIPNLKRQADNQAEIVEDHNEAVEKTQAICDKMWDVYDRQVLGNKTKKESKALRIKIP